MSRLSEIELEYKSLIRRRRERMISANEYCEKFQEIIEDYITLLDELPTPEMPVKAEVAD